MISKSQITYADKTAIYENSSIPDINKVNASDMNEIKSVVNSNYTETNNELDKRANYIVAGMSSSQQAPNNTIQKLKIDHIVNSNGTLLTLDSTNYEVVIGAGVHNVQISGQMYIYAFSGNGVRNIYIYNNSNIMARALLYISQSYQTIGITTKAISVQEGDRLSLRVISQGGTASISEDVVATYLYVKVID